MQQVSQTPHVLFLIFTIAVVFSVVVQAAVFVGVFVVVTRAVEKMMKIANQLSEKAGPIVDQVGGIVREVEPKIRTVSSQVVEISSAVRDQTMHVNTTVDEVVDKTNAQVAKVDEMVSAVIGTLAHAGEAVHSGVSRPARKVSSLLHGVRVGVETLFRSSPVRNGATDPYPRPVVAHDQAHDDLTGSDQTIQPPPTTSSAL